MKKIKTIKTLLAMLVISSLMFVMTACGSDDEPNVTTDEVASVEEVDVYEDLQEVLAVVSENLFWGDNAWEQIMLADDVPSPEMKYGLLVVPFFPSDLVQRHTRTVDINNGNFSIEIISADTGLSWFINQDGVITGGN